MTRRPPPPPQLSLSFAAPLLPTPPPVEPLPAPVPPPPPPLDVSIIPGNPARRRPAAQLIPEASDPPSDPSDLVSIDEALAMLREAREAAAARLAAVEKMRAQFNGGLHASLHLLEHGQLPHLGDPIPPWRLCIKKLRPSANFDAGTGFLMQRPGASYWAPGRHFMACSRTLGSMASSLRT